MTDPVAPVTAHLEELRGRLVTSLLAVAFFSTLSYFFVDPILDWLARPVGDFVYTTPAEAFFIRLKIAGGTGTFLAVPVILYQVWMFVAAALRRRERAFVAGLLPASVALFALGSLISIFVVLPAATRFLLSFSGPHLKPMISVGAYISFLFWMTIGFGVFFQLPLVVVMLAKTGLVDPALLAAYRRHVFVAIVVAAAFLTPGPDMFSQLVMAGPAYVLFEIALVIARRVYVRPVAPSA